MITWQKGHKLSSQLYVRQDGTRAFYFTKGLFLAADGNCLLVLEQVAELFSKEHGFEADDVTYIYRDTVNVKEQINVPRAFVQACFRKVSSEQ